MRFGFNGRCISNTFGNVLMWIPKGSAVFLLSIALQVQAQTGSSQTPGMTVENHAKNQAEQSTVLVLRPKVEFRDYRTDVILPGDRLGAEAYSARLRESAEAKLKDLGIITANSESSANPSLKEAVSLLEGQSSKLARGLVSEEAVNALNKTGPALNSSEILVFVQYMKATLLNPDWNLSKLPEPLPYGYGPKRIDNILLQAVLLSGKTGKIFWRDQVFIRNPPKVDSPKFSKLIEDLYKSYNKQFEVKR